MKHLKLFEKYNKKKISFYHGLGGEPAPDRIQLLESLGYEVHYPHIDFDREWELDKGKSLFKRELSISADSDIIMGTSLGGYLAYLLSKASGKDCILINPSINREKSRLSIREFDADFTPKKPKISVFFGQDDDLVIDSDQIDLLNKNKDNYQYFHIKGMAHRLPIDKFEEIISMIL